MLPICLACLDIFEDPVILKCGHSICKKCVVKHAKTQPLLPSFSRLPSAIRKYRAKNGSLQFVIRCFRCYWNTKFCANEDLPSNLDLKQVSDSARKRIELKETALPDHKILPPSSQSDYTIVANKTEPKTAEETQKCTNCGSSEIENKLWCCATCRKDEILEPLCAFCALKWHKEHKTEDFVQAKTKIEFCKLAKEFENFNLTVTRESLIDLEATAIEQWMTVEKYLTVLRKMAPLVVGGLNSDQLAQIDIDRNDIACIQKSLQSFDKELKENYGALANFYRSSAQGYESCIEQFKIIMEHSNKTPKKVTISTIPKIVFENQESSSTQSASQTDVAVACELQESTLSQSVPCLLLIGGKGTASVENYNALEGDHPLEYCRVDRYGHIGSVLSNHLVIAGGRSEQEAGSPRSTVLYDLNTNNWSSGAFLNSQRLYASSSLLNKHLYVLGGQNEASCEILDTLPHIAWRPISPLPRARWLGASVTLYDKVFLIGGLTTGRLCSRQLSVYSPERDEWAEAKELHVPCQGLAASILDSCIIVTGGCTDSRKLLAQCEHFDPRDGKWRRLAPMNAARAWHTLVNYKEQLLAMGGWQMRSVERYEERMDVWVTVESMLTDRWSFTAVEL